MNTLRIYIVGVGGQGNVLASKMIGEAALSMGVFAHIVGMKLPSQLKRF